MKQLWWGVSTITRREAKHQNQLTEWAGRISERNKSGMTIKEWCAENSFSERAYHYWLKQVREHAAQLMSGTKNTGAGIIPAEVHAGSRKADAAMKPVPAEAPIGWAVCRRSPEEAAPVQGITIEIGSGRITATAGTDLMLLERVCRMMVEL